MTFPTFTPPKQSLCEYMCRKYRADTAAGLGWADITSAIRPLTYKDAVVTDVADPEPPRFTETYTCSYQQLQENDVRLPSMRDTLVTIQKEAARRVKETADLFWRGYFDKFGPTRGVAYCDAVSWMGIDVIAVDAVLYDAFESTEYLFDSDAGEPLRVKFFTQPPEVMLRHEVDLDGTKARLNVILDVGAVILDGVFLKRRPPLPSGYASIDPGLSECAYCGA